MFPLDIVAFAGFVELGWIDRGAGSTLSVHDRFARRTTIVAACRNGEGDRVMAVILSGFGAARPDGASWLNLYDKTMWIGSCHYDDASLRNSAVVRGRIV
jgi:hypothetical protein